MSPEPERSGFSSSSEAFFPFTCHPYFSRRRFLVGVGALFGASAAGLGAGEAASDDGKKVIQEYATVPGDPWAVAHGIRAMGRDFSVRGGRRAVDYLLESVLTSFPANGVTALGFHPDVEGHPNAFLKTLLEAGVPLEHRFTHGGRSHTLGDVLEGARGLFRPQLVIAEPNALPWSLIAFTRTTSPIRRPWANAWGEPVNLDLVVESALQLYERASLPLAEAMRENRPEGAQAPVHAFTCGGTHMLYALLTAVHAGYVGRDRPERVRRQVDLMVWRLDADIDLIERFYKERARMNGVSWYEDWYEIDAKLKLLGHAEECLALGVKRGVATLTPAQQARRQAAVGRVRRMLDGLGRRRLEEAKALDRELYRQLIGDVCHARHGLTLV